MTGFHGESRARTCIGRRDALARIGAGGLAAAFAARALGAAAQEGATPVPGSVPPVIQAWVDAQNAMDPAAHAALYTADATLEDVPNHSSIQGSAIPPFLAGVLGGMGGVRVELIDAFSTGERGAAEYAFTATNRGLIPVPAAIGKTYSVRTVTIFQFAGDKISRSSDYYDLAAVLQQLGLAGAPGMPPAPQETPSA